MKHLNVNKDINKGMNSRRQFITKAAAGGVVAAIASKTAWAGGHSATGCSVSGNLSGNLSQARDCSTANVEGDLHTHLEKGSLAAKKLSLPWKT